MHTKQRSMGLLAVATALGFLARQPLVEAKEPFPGMVARHLQAPREPPCGLCHEYGKTGGSTLVTPFAWAMRARGLTGESSLLASLDRVAADGVDSDGDGSADVEEIVAGTDPNTAASTPAHPGTVADPQLGCAVASGAPVTPAASLLALTVLFLAATRRRRAVGGTSPAAAPGARCSDRCGMRNLVWVVAGATSLFGCVKQAAQSPQRAQQAQAVAAPRAPQPPQRLSPAVQALLRRRMVSHAHDMNELVSAIMILDYPVIADRAEQIAGDANLSRPIAGDATEPNASLPEQFFIYQERVRFEARGLVEAAGAADSEQVAASYGRLTESCIRCHADYRPRG